MTMSTLMCPHCGGRLLIDPALRLQSMLSCPYCGRKSLMQKKTGMIVLRGTISQVTPPKSLSDVEHVQNQFETETQQLEHTPEPIVIFAPPLIAPPEVMNPFMEASSDVEPDSADDERIDSVVPTESSEEPMTEIFSEPAAPEAPEELTAPAAPAVTSAPSESVTRDRTANKERLISLAVRTAAAGQIPAFNSYARQAIDCDPTDPNIYSIRARLIEEAHGFARATFLSPIWVDQTPRQKTWIIAQHFSSLNAAVTYSPEAEQETLASEAGALIAWQIRETFIENARLRLGKHPFNGKFTRKDLRMAPRISDACMCINETVVPHVSADLLRSIRQELAKLDPKLADRLERIGF